MFVMLFVATQWMIKEQEKKNKYAHVYYANKHRTQKPIDFFGLKIVPIHNILLKNNAVCIKKYSINMDP